MLKNHRALFLAVCAAFIQSCLAGEPLPASPVEPGVPAEVRSLPASGDSLSSGDTLLLSMQEAEGMFLRRNLALLASEDRLRSSESELTAAKLFPNPQFSVNASYIGLKEKPVDYSAAQTSYRIDQPLELWGKRGNRVEAAEHSVESARSDFQNTVVQLLSDFKESYVELVFAQRLHEITSASYQIFTQSVNIAGVRYRAGDIGEAEVKKLELEQLEYQQKLSSAEQEFLDAQASFRKLLNLRTARPMKLAYKYLPVPTLPGRDSIIAAALRSRPDLVSEREKLEMQQSLVSLAHAQAWPDLTVGVELDRQGPDFRNTFGGGITLSLPLFNRNQAEIQQSEADLEAAALDERSKENEVMQDIIAAYEKYKNSWMVMQTLSPSAMNTADDVRAMAVKSYGTGNIGLLDFLETERIYTDAVQSYQEAMKTYAINQVELERAAGVELFKENEQ